MGLVPLCSDKDIGADEIRENDVDVRAEEVAAVAIVNLDKITILGRSVANPDRPILGRISVFGRITIPNRIAIPDRIAILDRIAVSVRIAVIGRIAILDRMVTPGMRPRDECYLGEVWEDVKEGERRKVDWMGFGLHEVAKAEDLVPILNLASATMKQRVRGRSWGQVREKLNSVPGWSPEWPRTLSITSQGSRGDCMPRSELGAVTYLPH
ncbi:hypothetical protein V8D89_007427 [Ganoderma adspersum]